MGVQDRDWYREVLLERERAENKKMQRQFLPVKPKVEVSRFSQFMTFMAICGGIVAALRLLTYFVHLLR